MSCTPSVTQARTVTHPLIKQDFSDAQEQLRPDSLPDISRMTRMDSSWNRKRKSSISITQLQLNKTVRYGFLTNYKPLEYLFESSDTTLFSAILRRPGDVLHPLLPPLKTTGYHLRKHRHGQDVLR